MRLTEIYVLNRNNALNNGVCLTGRIYGFCTPIIKLYFFYLVVVASTLLPL